MLWTEKMFGVKKPIIAMLHIDPLPGDPLYKSGNDMDKVVEHAREDLHALQDGWHTVKYRTWPVRAPAETTHP